MKLADIINRTLPAVPWQEGEKIPWNEPAFSQRMLANHLSQAHDWASRRFAIIEQHVNWLDQQFSGKSARILDLGCGPGFYTHRLAKLGHQCVGVDFSPASINYAKQQAAQDSLTIDYILADVRDYQPSQSFDLIMMTFGEFNVFKAEDITALLDKLLKQLAKGGYLLIEAHTFEAIFEYGQRAASWQTNQTGLFLEAPHLYLEEHFWDKQQTTTTTRYYIVDADNKQTLTYNSSMKAYTDAEYQQLLQQAAITDIQQLSVEQWPTGDVFANKLQTFWGRKVG